MERRTPEEITAEVLAAGGSRAQAVAVATRLVGPAEAERLVDASLGAPTRLAAEYWYKWKKTQSLLRLLLDQVDRAVPGGGEMVDTHGLPDDFTQRFLLLNRPVVLRGLVANWLERDWSFEHLAAEFHDRAVKVSHFDPTDHTCLQRREHRWTVVPWVEFMRQCSAPEAPAPGAERYYLTARDNLAGQPGFEGLVAGMGPIEGLNDRPGPDALGPRFWIGGRDTITSLHHDSHNSVVCQLTGEKSLVLVSPRWSEQVDTDFYCFSLVRGGLDEQRAQLRRLHVPHHACTLQPGDAVFIPVGWWHAVAASRPAISVTLQDLNEDRFWGQPYLGMAGHRPLLRAATPWQHHDPPDRTALPEVG